MVVFEGTIDEKLVAHVLIHKAYINQMPR